MRDAIPRRRMLLLLLLLLRRCSRAACFIYRPVPSARRSSALVPYVPRPRAKCDLGAPGQARADRAADTRADVALADRHVGLRNGGQVRASGVKAGGVDECGGERRQHVDAGDDDGVPQLRVDVGLADAVGGGDEEQAKK